MLRKLFRNQSYFSDTTIVYKMKAKKEAIRDFVCAGKTIKAISAVLNVYEKTVNNVKRLYIV